MEYSSDIIIIGSGITGCAVARSLSGFRCSVLVLERESDLAEGATKANSGIVHAGYDAVPGTKKAYYNIRGSAMYPGLCMEFGVPYRRCGSLVIGFDEQDRKTIEMLKNRGETNGVPELSILERKELLTLEPNLNPSVLCALSVPTGAIVSPYEMAFALADDAALNGVSFRFNDAVLSVSPLHGGGYSVKTSLAEYTCRVLVNCAGSSGAEIHNQLSDRKLTMIHRRGEYYLLDRTATHPFSRTVFQCPSVMGKGVLVTPTVHGNVLIGPNAEDIDDPLDTATTSAGLSEVLQKAAKTWPALSVKTNITNFSGVRAHLTTDDFMIGPVPGCPGYFEAIGIESPGLSSAPAIAEDLSVMVSEYLGLIRKETRIPYSVPPRPFHDMTDAERVQAVSSNAEYGNMICRCEMVTEAEIRYAIRRPVGARSIDGVKRRTRAGMGRCQGGFCMPRVAAILSEETGLSLTEITKNGGGSFLLSDSIDAFLEGVNTHE